MGSGSQGVRATATKEQICTVLMNASVEAENARRTRVP